LGGRPFWNTAVLAPRFLVSAFACGPALLIIVFYVVNSLTRLEVKPSVINYLTKLLKIFLPLNLFLFGAEVFKEFYTNDAHTISMKYLFFGINGHAMLAPYIWSSLAMSLISLFILFTPLRKTPEILVVACILIFIGIWIEKGMGLVIPGFIPTPLGDFVEYRPSMTEFFVSLGIWALGAFLFTIFSKVAIAIQVGDLRESK
jgi:Ni/Fe-hydrogenase subunit HybB-like protein